METNTQRLLHTFAALADLGQEIADNADFEEMLRASFHLLLGSLAIRRGAVAEYDRERGQLRIAAMRGITESGQTELPLAHDHARRLASLGSALSFDDATKEAERIAGCTTVCERSTKRPCTHLPRPSTSRTVTPTATQCASASTARSSLAKWAGTTRKWKGLP